MILLKIILIVICAVIGSFFFVGWWYSENGYEGDKSDHFNGRKFINPSQLRHNGIKDVLRFILTREQDPWVRNYETYVRDTPLHRVAEDQVQITFVNHSTFLIQYADLNILTDPVWSERCSPSQRFGPRRQRPPGLRFEDLPDIDIVLVSHNHYDHLDRDTIVNLINEYHPTFICPLGLDQLIASWGAKSVISLDWWQGTRTHDIRVTAVPANHFSSRGVFDRDRTLWCGFVLGCKDHRIYFVGDTGYSSIFEEIGRKIGSMNISLIPIGAYLPRWFMSPIHVAPDQSVRIHQDVQSKHSIAMHFGTFPLADDNPQRAVADLIQAKKESGLTDEEFIIPNEGHSYIYKLHRESITAHRR